jgi:hypothetical protein
MFKKLIEKYQAHKDRKFLARFERVLNNNVTKSNFLLKGDLYVSGQIHMYCKRLIKDFEEGKPLSQITYEIHQESLSRLENLQSH